MQFRRLVRWLACAAFSLTACGGGGYAPANGGPGPAVPQVLYVDAVTGSDANPGSSSAPFKTITHALLVVQPGKEIRVRPGEYDAANGEVFPMIVPQYVTLRGDELTRGEGRPVTRIEGSGPVPPFQDPPHTWAAVALREGATLAGFVVRNAVDELSGAPDCSVVMSDPGATLRRCAVRSACDYGLWMTEYASGCAVLDNRIESSTYGIMYWAWGPPLEGNVFESNVVTGNFYGVEVYHEAADFGGGARGSAGGNTLAGNYIVDLSHSVGDILYARNCYWDAVPPIEAPFPPVPGTDIFILFAEFGLSSVDTTGAQLAGP